MTLCLETEAGELSTKLVCEPAEEAKQSVETMHAPTATTDDTIQGIRSSSTAKLKLNMKALRTASTNLRQNVAVIESLTSRIISELQDCAKMINYLKTFAESRSDCEAICPSC